MEVLDARLLDKTYTDQDLLQAFSSLVDDSWLEQPASQQVVSHPSGTSVDSWDAPNYSASLAAPAAGRSAAEHNSSGSLFLQPDSLHQSADAYGLDTAAFEDILSPTYLQLPPRPNALVTTEMLPAAPRNMPAPTPALPSFLPSTFDLSFIPVTMHASSSSNDASTPFSRSLPTTSSGNSDPSSHSTSGIYAKRSSSDNPTYPPAKTGGRGAAAKLSPTGEPQPKETKSRRRVRREKQALNDLESKVAEVQEQLSSLMRENAVLQSHRRVMDILLQCRADEMQRLSGQVPIPKITTLSFSNSDPRPDVVLLEPLELRKAFDTAVAVIATTALECDGPGASPQALAKLEAQVRELRQHTQRGLTKTPQKLYDMCSLKVDWDEEDVPMIARIVAAMSPSPQQVQECVTLWNLHLGWVARLEAERDSLTAALDGVLAQPRTGAHGVERSTGVPAASLLQLANAPHYQIHPFPALEATPCGGSSNAYSSLPSALTSATAAPQPRVGTCNLTESDIMERLMANLLRQKSLSRLLGDALWCPGIFTALQTARMMVHSHPTHPDLTAILRYIHHQHTRPAQAAAQGLRLGC